MDIIQPTENKKQHLDLLLLADKQESIIDRYLERGELFVLDDNAVVPETQRQGYGRSLINHWVSHYSGKYSQMMVGTGDVPSAVGFYKSRGFEYSCRIENFFTDNYDHQMIESGVLLKDMIYLKQEIQ